MSSAIHWRRLAAAAPERGVHSAFSTRTRASSHPVGPADRPPPPRFALPNCPYFRSPQVPVLAKFFQPPPLPLLLYPLPASACNAGAEAVPEAAPARAWSHVFAVAVRRRLAPAARACAWVSGAACLGCVECLLHTSAAGCACGVASGHRRGEAVGAATAGRSADSALAPRAQCLSRFAPAHQLSHVTPPRASRQPPLARAPAQRPKVRRVSRRPALVGRALRLRVHTGALSGRCSGRRGGLPRRNR